MGANQFTYYRHDIARTHGPKRDKKGALKCSFDLSLSSLPGAKNGPETGGKGALT